MSKLKSGFLGIGVAAALGGIVWFQTGDIGAGVKTALDKESAKAKCIELLSADDESVDVTQ